MPLKDAVQIDPAAAKNFWKFRVGLRYPIAGIPRLDVASHRLTRTFRMMKPERLKRDLRPALVFLSGELIAVPIPLEREEVILGRALEADVRVNDSKVSRRHAKIDKVLNENNQVEYVLTDFGSRNGILVNGQKVSREVLQNGDKIT